MKTIANVIHEAELQILRNELTSARLVVPDLILTDNWREAEPMTMTDSAWRVGATIRVRVPKRYDGAA